MTYKVNYSLVETLRVSIKGDSLHYCVIHFNESSCSSGWKSHPD